VNAINKDRPFQSFYFSYSLRSLTLKIICVNLYNLLTTGKDVQIGQGKRIANPVRGRRFDRSTIPPNRKGRKFRPLRFAKFLAALKTDVVVLGGVLKFSCTLGKIGC